MMEGLPEMDANEPGREGLAEARLASARRTVARPLLAAMVALVSVTAVVQLALAMLAPPGWPAWLPAFVGLAAGAASALVVSRLLADAIASAAAKPAELLIEQLGPDDSSGFNWDSGAPLSRAGLAADLKLLQRRSREMASRSRSVIGDLERAREQANQQNLAKSGFLANMSHELRTPLNAILGYAMLLHEDAAETGNQTAMEDLNRIEQAGRNLLALINDILDLANIETGRAKLERAVVEVRGLAESVAWSCGAQQSPNGNSFSLDIAAGVDIMVGDSAKIRQCLVNLLKNAFKFTRNGSVALEIAPLRNADSEWIEFAVRDTGIGIAAEDLDQLFEAFHQVNSSATRQYGGTGLGLAVVRRLAMAKGGTCTVESRPDQGSVFRLKLPIGDIGSDIARLRPKSSGEGAVRIIRTPDANHTVLLIDDDESTIELVQRWLGRMGYNIVASTSAEAALDLARVHRPDLILLDVFMPQKSGYDLLDELRAEPALASIPTILITVDDDRARGLKAGAAEHLCKPIAEEQLRAVLDVYRVRASGEILVIDDDDDSADLLTRCVGQVGFSARRAVDGLQGIAMASHARPSAIVLDLAMPGMNGFEVLDRLAEMDTLRNVPLIVVSACDISIEEHRRLASAGHRFFAKAAATPREIAQSLKELVA
jgi:signal transduction histidine kinase/DNA-binding response OmpR family regulator